LGIIRKKATPMRPVATGNVATCNGKCHTVRQIYRVDRDCGWTNFRWLLALIGIAPVAAHLRKSRAVISTAVRRDH